MAFFLPFREQLSGLLQSVFDSLLAQLSVLGPLRDNLTTPYPASSVLVTDAGGVPSFGRTIGSGITVGTTTPFVRSDGSVVLPTPSNFLGAIALPPTAADKGGTAVANAFTATSVFGFSSHGFMAAETYAWSKASSTSAEVIGIRSVAEQGGTGPIVFLDGVQSFLRISGTGGGTSASCFIAYPQGQILTGASGTFTNGYGLFVNGFGPGFTNIYALYSNDTVAGILLRSDVAVKATTNTWQVTSDARTKRDVRPFTDGLNVLSQLKPVHFTYNGVGDTVDGTKGIGLIAQEAEPYAPTLIKSRNASDGETYKMLDSGDVTWMLVNAVKELQAQVAELKRQLEEKA